MFHIFKKKKDAQGQAQGGQLQDVQLRPVEQAGAEPLDHRLERSRSQFGQKLRGLLNTHPALDEDLLEELETTLLTADVGVKATLEIISNLRAAISNKTITDPASLLPDIPGPVVPCCGASVPGYARLVSKPRPVPDFAHQRPAATSDPRSSPRRMRQRQ